MPSRKTTLPLLSRITDAIDGEVSDFGDPEVTQKYYITREVVERSAAHIVLKVAAGPDMLKLIQLHPGDRVVVGRDDSAALVLTDPSVSRQHAVLTVGQDGSCTVEDLDSMNGTRVNGRRIESGTVRMNDHLEVGRVSLRLDCMTQEELAHHGRVVDRLTLTEGRDPLTGLRQRLYLDNELPALVQGCQDRRFQIACAFMDIDHFKSVNDTFGHLTGDEVLRTVARLIMLDCRDSDACFRYGGEEFVVLLMGANKDKGFSTANRIRGVIQAHDWTRTHPALTSLTVSIGVAELKPDDTPARWLERADQALYRAKNGGRNRVVVAP